MKREAISHTKMKRLCRRLDIPTYQGVGIMESIWQLAAREAPRGDIGKLSVEDIALGIDYRGDENKLVEALVATGWLDRSEEFKLVVHDWDEHADDAVHMRLARARLHFCSGRAPKLARLGGKERESAHEYYIPCAQTNVKSAPPEPRPARTRTPPEPEPRLSTTSDGEYSNIAPLDGGEFSLQPPSEKPMTAAQRITLWFERDFWPLYPRQLAEEKALKAALKQLPKSGKKPSEIIAALKAQLPKFEAMIAAGDMTSVPYGATWINGKRWKDQIEPVASRPTLAAVPDRIVRRQENNMLTKLMMEK